MTLFSLYDVLPIRDLSLDIIDIGARYTEAERYASLIGRSGVRVTGFEPDANQLAILERRHPFNKYLPYFIGDGRVRTFHHCHYGGCSSFYPPNREIIAQFTGLGTDEGSNFAVTHTEEVATCRLDDVKEIDKCQYLKIDVQGAELDVLHGAEHLLEGVLFAEIEVEFLPVYTGQPLFAEIDQFMRLHGFYLHRLVDISGRAFQPFNVDGNLVKPVSQLLWADAIFLRRFTEFDRYENDDLLRLALLAHDLYGSIDLCGRLLALYDHQKDTQFSLKYLHEVSIQQPNISFINVKDWAD